MADLRDVTRDGARDGRDASQPAAMSSAERARRYRQRRREERETAGSGIDPDTGEWSPVFPGQRPPLQPGHQLSLVHGAYSPQRVETMAAGIVKELLDSPSCPAHLRDDPEAFAPLLELWGSAMAVCRLLRAALTTGDVLAGLSEFTEGLETERRPAMGQVNRKTRVRRTGPILDALHRHETRAMNLSVRLGLDAASRARAGTAAPTIDVARYWADRYTQQQADERSV